MIFDVLTIDELDGIKDPDFYNKLSDRFVDPIVQSGLECLVVSTPKKKVRVKIDKPKKEVKEVNTLDPITKTIFIPKFDLEQPSSHKDFMCENCCRLKRNADRKRIVCAERLTLICRHCWPEFNNKYLWNPWRPVSGQ